MIDAVVLAGGPPDDVARMQPGAANKAFVRIDGITLVERTLRPLRESSAIGRIIVVAPERTHDDSTLALADDIRSDGTKIRTSLRNGLRDLQPERMVAVVASDLPILTVAAVDDFVERSLRIDPDIGYGCVERTVHMARFPEVPHTWAALRDGVYCGGGIVTIKPHILPKLEVFIESLGHARKNPLRLASLFGWDMLLRFAIRRLTIAQAQERASKMIGGRVRAIVSPFAETGVNVDRPSDVALAEQLLRRAPTFE